MARELVVRLIGDDASLRRTFTRSSRAAGDFDKSLGKSARGALAATVSFRGMGRSLAFASNSFLGGAGAVFAVKAFSEAASNMAEQTSKANVVFGASTRVVQNFANNALGLARDEALQTASTFGALLRPLGLTGDAAANASVRLTKLGIDFASFFNTDVTDALAAINSGLVGEVEPLRRYGVLLSQARVQQEALRESGKKSVKQLTNQEVVQARIALIFRDSAQAQGDFARTQGGLANQQRLLSQNVRNLEISLGQALNPTILEVTKSLNKWLSNSENQKKVTNDLRDATKSIVAVLKAAKAVIDDVDKVTGGLKNTLELLVALKFAPVVAGWAGALSKFASAEKAVNESAVVSRINAYTGAVAGTGAAAQTSAKQVGGLKGALGGLGLIQLAPILIPIELALTERARGFLDKLGKLGDLGKIGFDIAAAPTSAGNLFGDVKSLLGISGNDVPTAAKFSSDPTIQNVGLITFRNLRKALNDALASAAAAGDTGGGGGRGGLTASQRNTFFDNAIARLLQRGGLGTINQQIASLEKANTLIARRLKATNDVTRQLKLEDEIAQNAAQIKDLRTQQAADALQKRQDAFSDFISRLQLGVTKAQATKSFTDDITALKALQAGIKKEIREFGLTADLQQQLFDVQQQIVDARKQQKQAVIDAATARQFKTLGLTATGDERTPLVAGLKKRLAQLTANVNASSLNTPKLQSQLAAFRKVLNDKLFPPQQEVRARIKEMMDGIAQEIKNANGPLTKTTALNANAVLNGLGIGAQSERIIRARLSHFNSAGVALTGAGTGSRSVTVNAPPVYLDGRLVSKNVGKHQARTRKRNAAQRNGPNAGIVFD